MKVEVVLIKENLKKEADLMIEEEVTLIKENIIIDDHLTLEDFLIKFLLTENCL